MPLRAARRKQSPAPKRADTPAPTLAVDGAHTSARKSDVTPTRRLAAAKKKPVPAAARRCANCGAAAPKKRLRRGGRAFGRRRRHEAPALRRVPRDVLLLKRVPEAAQTRAQEGLRAAGGNAGGGHAERHRRRSPPGASARCGGGVAAEPAAPADAAAAAAAAAAEGARRFQSLRARLGAATVAFSRGATGQAVSALQDIAMEAHELFDRHALGRDIECEALRVAGHGMIRMRAWEPAEKCLDACLGVARLGLEDDPPLPPGAAIGAFVALGTLASAREPPEFDLSQQWFAHALQVAREAGDVAAEASVCQSLAGVAGKMGDGAAAAQAAEMALGLRRAKLEEAGRTLVAAEEALAAFTVTVTQSQAPPSVGTEDAADPTPQPGSEAIGVAPATGGRPATAPPITSPDHARAFACGGGEARARRGARARRWPRSPTSARRCSRCRRRRASRAARRRRPKQAPKTRLWGPTSLRRPRTPEMPRGTLLPRLASPRAWRGTRRRWPLCAGTRRDRRTSRWRSGFCWSSPTRTTTAWAATPGAPARVWRARRSAAVKALTANQREFPNTCTLCSETMDVIENEGEVDTHASTTGSGPDAAAATRPVTCLECLHGYHSACLLRWREEKLVEEMEKMEKAKGRERTSPGGNRRSRGVPTACCHTREPRRRRRGGAETAAELRERSRGVPVEKRDFDVAMEKRDFDVAIERQTLRIRVK